MISESSDLLSHILALIMFEYFKFSLKIRDLEYFVINQII